MRRDVPSCHVWGFSFDFHLTCSAENTRPQMWNQVNCNSKTETWFHCVCFNPAVCKNHTHSTQGVTASVSLSINWSMLFMWIWGGGTERGGGGHWLRVGDTIDSPLLHSGKTTTTEPGKNQHTPPEGTCKFHPEGRDLNRWYSDFHLPHWFCLTA